MFNLLIRLLIGVLTKLVTADFFEKMVLMSIHWISQKTTNNLDNTAGLAIADALGKTTWYENLK